MGGKGYKPRKDYAGRTVSGDWEDSDRGAGNKAKRRAGGKVEKKSPTYQAYVLNKEHHQKDAEGKVIEHGDGTPSSVEEDYYRGTGEKVVARTKKWMDKKGQKGAPGLDAMKARTAEHKAKRGVKEEIELKEYSPNVAYQAKGGKKSGKLGKSSIYSLRGKDESKKDFRKSHVKDVEDGYVGKGHKPTPGSLRKEEVVTELNRYGKETGKATGSLNKRPGSPVKTGGSGDKALQSVQRMIRRDYGRPEGQRKKERGKKPPVAGEYGARRSPEQIVKKRRWDKERATAAMIDTRGT